MLNMSNNCLNIWLNFYYAQCAEVYTKCINVDMTFMLHKYSTLHDKLQDMKYMYNFIYI